MRLIGVRVEQLTGDEAQPALWDTDDSWREAERAIDELPPAQRAVITMRDIQGFTSEEVCNALDLTETNQRVLLHRARAKVRKALEDYMR